MTTRQAVVTDQKSLSQPACPRVWKSMKRDMDSNIDVMLIYVCACVYMMWRSFVVYLYIGVKLPADREG